MPDSRTNLLTATVVAVFRANGQLIDWGDRFVAPFDLTSARWQMLGALALAGQAITVPQIAADMGVTRQGAQKQINLLLEEGLVERLANPAHKRSPQYRLTARGREIYQAVEARWNEHARALADNFSEGDLEAASRVLDALARMHSRADAGEDHES